MEEISIYELGKQVTTKIYELQEEPRRWSEVPITALPVMFSEIEKSIEKYRNLLLDMIELDPYNPEWQQRLKILNDTRFTMNANSDFSLLSPTLIEYEQLWIVRQTYSEKLAMQVCNHSEVLEKICPALVCITDDVFEIAKVVTPILAGLAIAGSISLPLAPILFATIAILISRMNIKSICHGYIK